MRTQTVRNEVIVCLADGHWWTAGELADTIDCYDASVQSVLLNLEQSGFVERFDDEQPEMFGWTVEPKAVERASLEEKLKGIIADALDILTGPTADEESDRVLLAKVTNKLSEVAAEVEA